MTRLLKISHFKDRTIMDTQVPPVLQSIDTMRTAAELRTQLHTMKANDQKAVMAASQVTTAERFLKSQWFTALLTGLGTFGLLYLTKPAFVLESQSTMGNGSGGEDRKITTTLSTRRIFAWSILAALIVAVGPMVFKRISPLAT